MPPPSSTVPAPLTSFVGRERERDAIKRLLAATRLLTLTGPGGCGKTRLAVEVAAELVRARTFADGVSLVDLAALSDPTLVPHAVASALGVRETSEQSMAETLVGSLRSRNLLLVLDNCEHLIADCATLAQSLLTACPDLRILATSREVLRVTGETAWPVPSLSLPRTARSTGPAAFKVPPLAEMNRSEAVRLFVERASAARPGFSLRERNAGAIAQICRRLDGIPLAIELAAARMRVLSAEQLAGRLDDALRLLTSGSRTAMPRHQTLRATIDWSYDLLSDEEKTMLGRVVVFAGGFSLEAAEAVSGGDDEGSGPSAQTPLDLLTHLADKSLLVMREQPGEVRYYILETIRQYGRSLLEPDAAAALRQAHAAYFLGLTERNAPKLLQADRSVWLARLERDEDNLRAALRWAVADARTEVTHRLAAALWWFWFHAGRWSEGRQWLEQALALDEQAGHRARVLLGAGVLAWVQGDHTTARACLEESVVLARDDRPTLGHALHFLSQTLLAYGELDAAHIQAERAVALFREEDDAFGLPASLVSLGIVAHVRGDYALSSSLLAESATRFRAAGDAWGLSLALRNLGIIALRQGRYGEAVPLLEETLGLLRDLGERRWFISRSIETLAEALALQGDGARAARLFGAAETLREAIGASVLTAYRADYDAGVAAVRAGLGEEAFAAAWAEGRAMSQEQAIAYAFREKPPPEPDAGSSSRVSESGEDAPALRLHALGPAEVYREEVLVPPHDWGYARPKEVLFYLLLHGPKTKDQVGLVFWPEASSSQLRNNFHVTLHHLRRALGRPEWIVYEHGRYLFNRALPYWLDVEAFEQHLEAARQGQAREPALALRHLEDAVSLYRGDLLEEIDGSWHVARQDQLRRRYLDAVLALGGLLTAEARHAQALEVYRQATLHAPYFEAAHRGLMRCYARLGERSQALLLYRSLVERLQDELGVPPEAETTALFEHLRLGEPVDG